MLHFNLKRTLELISPNQLQCYNLCKNALPAQHIKDTTHIVLKAISSLWLVTNFLQGSDEPNNILRARSSCAHTLFSLEKGAHYTSERVIE